MRGTRTRRNIAGEEVNEKLTDVDTARGPCITDFNDDYLLMRMIISIHRGGG